jgi:hypothetical protein
LQLTNKTVGIKLNGREKYYIFFDMSIEKSEGRIEDPTNVTENFHVADAAEKGKDIRGQATELYEQLKDLKAADDRDSNNSYGSGAHAYERSPELVALQARLDADPELKREVSALETAGRTSEARAGVEKIDLEIAELNVKIAAAKTRTSDDMDAERQHSYNYETWGQTLTKLEQQKRALEGEREHRQKFLDSLQAGK